MIKKVLIGLGLLVLAAFCGIYFLEKSLLSALQKNNVEFESMERGLFSREFKGVRYRGLDAERVLASMFSPKSVKIIGLNVRINPESGVDKVGAEGPSSMPEGFNAQLRQVSFFWDDTLLADSLSGEMANGRIVLDGPGVHLSSGSDKLQVDWDGLLPFDAISGKSSIHLLRSGRISIEAEVPKITLQHDLLDRVPVHLQDGILKLEGDRLGHSLHGTLTVNEVVLQVHVDRKDMALEFDVVLGPSELAAVLAPLESHIPELKKAEINGQVSGQLQFQWPEKTWDGDFHLENVDVQNAVPQVYALRKGRLQHRVRDQEGDAILRETGEGSSDWAALRNIAAPMRHAVIAAEDIRFTEHPGYDMDAIREAFQANHGAGKVLRGGSSLTQQLAKNLYLDGQRTLIRKIRELLLAVELDRTLGKGRVLELYLNVVEWGPGIYGIRAASERYFMRRPSQLQPHEAAFLAAILPSPRRFYDEQYLKNKARETRIDWILENMGDANQLSKIEVDKWSQKPLRFVPPPNP
jgi:monofunctional biosynthetic peptidoglycan transglycosylase